MIRSGFFFTLSGQLAILRVGTLCLITFLATTSQYFILPASLSDASRVKRLQTLVSFNFGITLIYWTFYLSCLDPGSVRHDYVPPDNIDARYCKTCKAFKPPRTHHCKKCGRCILRMDHHCPWLSGCVGYYNHAAFIKFMLCVVPTTGFLAWTSAVRLWNIYYSTTGSSPAVVETCITVSNLVRSCSSFVHGVNKFHQIASLCVCMMVTTLLLYQLWCLVENITTIESWHKKRTEDFIRRKKIPPIDFPYDLYSTSDNLREVLGHRAMWLWLWPNTRATGTGHAFPVNEDADTSRPWPPQLPSAVADSELATKAVDKNDKLPDIRSRKSIVTDEDDLTFNDYAKLGFIHDSDGSDDDYVDGDGEDLQSYGVDDEQEVTDLTGLTGEDGTTLEQLLVKKRLNSHQYQ